jgi:AcrR family transcriptional regulator
MARGSEPTRGSGATTVEPASERRERAAHLGPARRRPLVLDAALRLFVADGYNGTSMDAIAEAAGVTKPVVYDCYPSKQELFRALLQREERRLLASVEDAMPSEISFDDPEGLLADGFAALLRAAAADPDSWRVVFDSEHGAEPAIVRRVRRARATIVARIEALVEPYLGEVGAKDHKRKAPVLAELLTSIGEAGVRVLLASNGRWRPEELGALLGRVAARGPSAA